MGIYSGNYSNRNSNKSKIACIHHNDLDGYMSAAIVDLHVRSTVNFGEEGGYVDNFEISNYNDFSPMYPAKKGYSAVYIVDISITEANIQHVLDIDAPSIIVIDHHKSTEDFVKENQEKLNSKDIVFIVDTNRCGAFNVFYQLFVNNSDKNDLDEYPLSVILTDDWDRHVLAHENSLTFNYGMKRYLDPVMLKYNNSSFWDTILDYDYNCEEITNEGEVIVQFLNAEAEKHARENVYLSELDGYKVLALNNLSHSSQEFTQSIIQKYKPDILSIYHYDGKGYTYSIYQPDKSSTIDCSKIAKKYGGGGHPGAAGFHSDKLLLSIKE